jgi:hypothetical protein
MVFPSRERVIANAMYGSATPRMQSLDLDGFASEWEPALLSGAYYLHAGRRGKMEHVIHFTPSRALEDRIILEVRSVPPAGSCSDGLVYERKMAVPVDHLMYIRQGRHPFIRPKFPNS